MLYKIIFFLCSDFYYSPLRGALAIFSTGTYAGIGTMCVESETCYEKYHEKTNKQKMVLPHWCIVNIVIRYLVGSRGMPTSGLGARS